MKKIILYSIIAASILNFTSCSDFLDQPPAGDISGEDLVDKRGLDMLVSGMYATLKNDSYFDGTLSNYAYGDVMGGSANKGSDENDQPPFTSLETYRITADNDYINVKWLRVYDGVSRTNEVLSKVEANKEAFSKIDGLAKDYYTEVVAQARFLRGLFHFEGAKTFGAAIPFITLEDYNSSVDPRVSNVDKSGKYIYIWDKICEDFQFAYDNLPDAWPSEPGRANKWAAAVFLAKTRMYQSSPYNGKNGTENKWAEVKSLLETIITNGKDSKGTSYRLANTYEELWTAGQSNWTGESVFDIQMTIVGTNEMLSSINGGPHIAPPGALGASGWGFYQPSNDLVDSHMVDDDGLPFLDYSYQQKGALTRPAKDSHGNEIANTPITKLEVFTDPRLDISTGRFNIPYWDFDIPETTDGWVRKPSNGGYYINKKNMPKKKDRETGLSLPSIAASTTKGFHLIRYADVLLWYAEALIETGDPTGAREYVNRVRARAANSYVKAGVKLPTNDYVIEATSSYILDDKVNGVAKENAASNYRIGLYPASQFESKEKALEALRFERKIELAMEGQRWYDLTRWGIAATELNNYLSYEKKYLDKYSTATYSDKWICLPIPSRQIITMEGVLVQSENWK